MRRPKPIRIAALEKFGLEPVEVPPKAFACPEDGCIAVYQTPEELGSHLERHRPQPKDKGPEDTGLYYPCGGGCGRWFRVKSRASLMKPAALLDHEKLCDGREPIPNTLTVKMRRRIKAIKRAIRHQAREARAALKVGRDVLRRAKHTRYVCTEHGFDTFDPAEWYDHVHTGHTGYDPMKKRRVTSLIPVATDYIPPEEPKTTQEHTAELASQMKTA